MDQSNKWELNYVDLCKWGKNAAVFLAPLALVYLASVKSALDTDGFAWSDFAFTPAMWGAFSLYMINAATDLFRKLAASPK